METSALTSHPRKTGFIAPFVLTFSVLTLVHVQVEPALLLAERFMPGTGWIEIVLASVYAGWLFTRMQDPKNVARWRKISWLVFTFVFFSQLLLGVVADERFLMTGRLHLPIPAMIVAGPLYRMQLSFMPVLFLTTVLITGPAWCSQLCYFGSLDNWAASGNALRNRPIRKKTIWKHSLLMLFITTALLCHFSGVSNTWATLAGLAAGVIGLAIILSVSRKKNKMIHCIVYCPVGTLVNYLRFVSPFRMRISDSCTTCMACTLKCRYDALNLEDIRKRRPGMTCTFCGECLPACHQQSIHYHFPWLSANQARNFYLVLVISLHACFLTLARI